MRKYAISALLIVINSQLLCGQIDSVNVENYLNFSEKLIANNSYWKSVLKDDSNFNSFIMIFSKSRFNGLEGTISGLTTNRNTIDFWKVYEFIDYHSGEIHFIQTSNSGNVISNSQYPDSITRTSDFEVTYSNGAKEKHRDKHIFLDENTLYTDSDLFDQASNKWIPQPRLIWRRIKA